MPELRFVGIHKAQLAVPKVHIGESSAKSRQRAASNSGHTETHLPHRSPLLFPGCSGSGSRRGRSR